MPHESRSAITRVSQVADLLDPSGQRHVHSKVMVFGVTASVLLILAALLVVKADHLGWPDVAALAMVLVAPYGLDGYKTLVKLRYGSALPAAPPSPAHDRAPNFADPGQGL